jgi:excisionase family DNA binding protein
MPQTPIYRTLEETAEILRANTRSVRRYIKDGKIPFVRLGRKYLFRESDLLNLPSTRKGTRK